MATNWQTPTWFFDKLDKARGKYAVDAAASADNALVQPWYGPGSPIGENALAVAEWLSPAFCNPPYASGKEWEKWLLHFIKQADEGREVDVLMPAATGTEWWWKYVIGAKADVIFIGNGRIPFTLPEMTKKSAPNHASALIAYSPLSTGQVGWVNLNKFKA